MLIGYTQAQLLKKNLILSSYHLNDLIIHIIFLFLWFFQLQDLETGPLQCGIQKPMLLQLLQTQNYEMKEKGKVSTDFHIDQNIIKH